MNSSNITTRFYAETYTVSPASPGPSDDDPSCDIYREWRRKSKGFIIRGYEGIPQNLLLNVIGLVILVLVFSILRKKAWNYGRIALLNDVGWSTLFSRTSADKVKGNKYTRRSETTQVTQGTIDDSGYFDWIRITYSLTDAQFMAKSGPDALQYLSYQRHLIFLAAIITLASLLIVLPLNLQGSRDQNALPDISVFEQSTIFNLGSDSRLLWIHEALALVFLVLSIVVMRHFSRSLKFVQGDSTTRRTVMLAGIAKKYCTESRVRRHIMEVHPDFQIEEFSLAYDVSKLVDLEEEKAGVATSRKYWEEYIMMPETGRQRPHMRPFTCGNVCCCCCVVNKSDALEYYTELEYKLRTQSELERKRAYARPLGIAFVTFTTRQMAETIMKEYRLSARLLLQIPSTRYSRRLKARNWVASFAPLPEDLHWQHLSLGYRAWYFKAIVVNLTLVIIVLFYSTPVFLLNGLSVYLEIQKFVSGGNATANHTNNVNINSANANVTGDGTASTIDGILRDTVPTFLLWLAAVTLPSLVSLSDRFVGFWTKTAENRSKMIKTFTFLLFMVIILPSLGLTSASSFFLRDKPPQWKCIFSPSNGSFFVNYVITSCFLGTMSELMRIPELLVYGCKICFAKSAADIGAIRKSVLWDFQLGSQYAWMMLIFAIFILFSLVTPIITIFGFIYLIFKHYVDRYNIYFAYAPCKVDKVVHGTAINFVVVCTFLQQLILVAYISSNAHPVEFDPPHHPHAELINKPLQAFAILGFCVTAALFIGQVFFDMCTNFSPISYNSMFDVEYEGEGGASVGLTRGAEPSSNRFNPLVSIFPPPRSSGDTNGEAALQIVADGGSPTGTIQSTSSGSSSRKPTTTEAQALEPHGSSTISTTTESVEERLFPFEPSRPGIDKPYGRYFPTVLRMKYDNESAVRLRDVYFKSVGTREPRKKVYSPSYVRDQLIVQTRNDLNGSSPVTLAIIPTALGDDSSSSSNDDTDFVEELAEVESVDTVPDLNANHTGPLPAQNRETLLTIQANILTNPRRSTSPARPGTSNTPNNSK